MKIHSKREMVDYKIPNSEYQISLYYGIDIRSRMAPIPFIAVLILDQCSNTMYESTTDLTAEGIQDTIKRLIASVIDRKAKLQKEIEDLSGVISNLDPIFEQMIVDFNSR